MTSILAIEVNYNPSMEHLLAKMAAGKMGLDSYLNSALVTASWKVQAEMKSRAPEGVGAVSGYGLKQSITREINSATKTATIGPTVAHAAPVENGSRPHMPPTDPNGALAQWCEMKGLSLWAVAMSIKRNGTKAHPYAEPTFRVMQRPVEIVFEKAIANFMED